MIPGLATKNIISEYREINNTFLRFWDMIIQDLQKAQQNHMSKKKEKKKRNGRKRFGGHQRKRKKRPSPSSASYGE